MSSPYRFQGLLARFILLWFCMGDLVSGESRSSSLQGVEYLREAVKLKKYGASFEKVTSFPFPSLQKMLQDVQTEQTRQDICHECMAWLLRLEMEHWPHDARFIREYEPREALAWGGKASLVFRYVHHKTYQYGKLSSSVLAWNCNSLLRAIQGNCGQDDFSEAYSSIYDPAHRIFVVTNQIDDALAAEAARKAAEGPAASQTHDFHHQLSSMVESVVGQRRVHRWMKEVGGLTHHLVGGMRSSNGVGKPAVVGKLQDSWMLQEE
ncbi:MAG: hypothetical protein M1826_006876 [Phylliscum demangeonii]|nr:MAG: hypothetical protein M1826_006876 [Phylliscum demangeonii]